MASTISLLVVICLLLPYLIPVSPATDHLTNHHRDVTRKSLGHNLKASSKRVPPNIKGLANNLGRRPTSSNLIRQDIRSLTNDDKEQKPLMPWERRPNTFSEDDSPDFRRDNFIINTIQVSKRLKRKRRLAQVSNTAKQKLMNSKSEPQNVQLAENKSRAPGKFDPDMKNDFQTFVSPRSNSDRKKSNPRQHAVPRTAKDRQEILLGSGLENSTQDYSTFYNAKTVENKSAHNGNTKPMASSLSKHRNPEDPNKSSRESLSDFELHDMSPNSEGKHTDIPNFLEEKHHIGNTDEDVQQKAGGKTVYMEDDKAVGAKQIHDKFRCGNCKCSYAKGSKIIAQCTDKFIAMFPDDLPTNTWQLILLGNHIKWLNMTHLSFYLSLSHLKISNNTRFRFIEKSVENITSLMTELDLSENKIDSIDDNSFEQLPHLLTLNLAFNHVKEITNLTFAGLDNLRSLNLSKNTITHTDSAAFDNLKKLQTLDLSRNRKLILNKNVLSSRLMEPLKQLRYLLLHGSLFDSEQYPNQALGQLINLQRLSIDGIRKAVFGPEISTLKHLTHLDIGFNHGKCHITNISDVFFHNLPYLINLTLTSCYSLRRIESTIPGKPLCKTLRHLKIEQIVLYDLTTALCDLKAFQDSSLQSLALVALYNYDGRLPCRFLSKENAVYIKNHPLEELDLSGNGLSVLTNDFIAELPKTLKRLILTDNMLSLDGLTLKKLSVLNNLIEVDTSYQNMDIHNFPLENMYMYQEDPEYILSTLGHVCQAHHTAVYCSRDKNLQPAPKLKDIPVSELISTGLDYPCPPKKCLIRGNSTMSNIDLDSKLRLNNMLEDSTPEHRNPPKLQIIRASYHNSFGMRILSWYSRSKNTFKEVYFSNSFLTKLSLGSLPPSIEIADLSNNYCDSIGAYFFQPNNSLIYLSLQNNVLGEEFANDTEGLIFAKLSKTKYLDLRKNLIFELPQNFFGGLSHLETLKLSKNKLQVLDVRFSHMKSLQTLTLRKNSISWISRETRNDLDILAASHPLQVDLTMNPLPCTCEGLELINWMAMTNVRFKHKADLKCRLGDGKTVEFGDLQERSRSLQRHCASKPLIIVICVASICVMAILVGFSVLYRYRWKLRYLKHIVLVRMVGFKPQQNQGQGYKFDAYILYTEETRRFVHVHFLQELETRRSHRLCICERDFLPGTYNLSNIVSAIQNSAKTVVVVTPELYEDEYSEYGIKMAIMEELYKNRNVLHLCVYQPMTPDDMARCHDLLMVMKRNHYTEYPPDDQATEEIRQNFWDQLSLAIGHEHDPQVPAELEIQ